MATTHLTTTLEIEECDCDGNVRACFEVAIEATYTSSKGDRDRYGVQMEPDYEEMEIDSCTLEDGDDYTLSEADEERAKEKLWEALKDSWCGF